MLGIGASPGIAIGKAFVLSHQEIEINEDMIQTDEIAVELQRLKDAVDRMNEKISHLYQPLHPAILRLVKIGGIIMDLGLRQLDIDYIVFKGVSK